MTGPTSTFKSDRLLRPESLVSMCVSTSVNCARYGLGFAWPMLLACAQTLQDEAAAHFIGRTVWESVVAALNLLSVTSLSMRSGYSCECLAALIPAISHMGKPKGIVEVVLDEEQVATRK